MSNSLEVALTLNAEINLYDNITNTRSIKKSTQVLDRYVKQFNLLNSQRYFDSFFILNANPLSLNLTSLGFSSLSLVVLKSTKLITVNYKVSDIINNQITGKVICISNLENNIIINNDFNLNITKIEAGDGELELLIVGNLLSGFPTITP